MLESKRTFDFQQYVDLQKKSGVASVKLSNYAYAEDMQRLRRLMDIPFLPEVMQRGLKMWSSAEHLGINKLGFNKLGFIKLGLNNKYKSLNHVPEVAKAWQEVCAEMHVEQHEVRIIPDQKVLFTPYGDKTDVYFGISPAACALTKKPLRFVFGQGIGALANGHVPYMTLSYIADNLTGGLYGRIAMISDALFHWQQAAEITHDRAGLLAARDMSAAIYVIMKSTLSWDDEEIMMEIRRYYEHKDVDFGDRSVEIRIQALEIFAKSAFYAEALGRPSEGLPTMTEIDEQVAQIAM